jgi:hypothetical protein
MCFLPRALTVPPYGVAHFVFEPVIHGQGFS